MFVDDVFIFAQCHIPAMTSLLLTAAPKTSNVDDVINGLNNGTNVVETNLDNTVTKLGSTGFSLIQKIGIYAAVIVFVGAGIGFLLSSGQDREDKKKGLIMKVVGIVLIVGATGIVGALAAFSNGLFTTAGTK